MGLKAKVVDWFNKTIRNKAEKIYDFTTPISDDMEKVISDCARVYGNKPKWMYGEDAVNTVNVAKIICTETARLIKLGLDVQITGSSRAEWLQSQIDTLFSDNKLRTYIEYCMAYGTLAFKPNGESVDIFKPNEFVITKQHNGVVEGIVFFYDDNVDDVYYTRLERHEMIDGRVYVTNKAFEGSEKYDCRKQIPLESVEIWADIEEEWDYECEALFSILKVADANNIDTTSPLGLPLFANALEEVKDFDIAYSRYAGEVFDSEKIVLIDSDRMLKAGVKYSDQNVEAQKKKMKLPHYVRNVMGDGVNDFYQEINPQLNISTRLEGLKFNLSFIGYKCGFSGGYFNIDQKSGMVTATQVEADDRRTIELIKDNREALKICLDQLIEALNTIAEAYKIDGSGSGTYEVAYNFEDITHNVEEDRNRWYSYVISGQIPFWYFLTKFEGMTEQDAKAVSLVSTPTLFNEPSAEPSDMTKKPNTEELEEEQDEEKLNEEEQIEEEELTEEKAEEQKTDEKLKEDEELDEQTEEEEEEEKAKAKEKAKKKKKRVK